MTTNAWDHAESLAEQHASSGSIFVRLANNGDKVVGAFCGEPLAREVVWTGERYETYDPDVHTDKRPSLRVLLNFFVPAEGAMKVIEGGTLWFKSVTKVKRKYGLDKWLFEVERHGEAGDSKTRYSVLPERQIDGEMLARIEAAELHDLASIGSGDEEGAAEGKGTATRPGGTVDARVAGDFVARLKALPRSDVDTFLGELGIQRVRDLKASDEKAARALLDRLEAAHGQEPDASIDPFA